MTKLGLSDLDVFPLCLGANVFGWTADRDQSFAVLDAYAAGGGNFVDTADVYPAWVPGNSGGESETIIGEWLAARGNRDAMVVATKGCRLAPNTGLSAKAVHAAAEASLRRLGVDHIDLYYAHYDDPDTPVEETVTAYDELVRTGKVRYVAVSNMSPERITESLAFAEREGMARYVGLQPHYNLVEREGFEGELADLAARWQLATLPYYALARGFLTGKYRTGTQVDSPRAGGASAYLTERGLRVLAVLDQVSAARHTTVAAVALAWLLSRPSVVAPIASARNPEQLAELMPMADLALSPAELAALDSASAS
ncbi:MAG TPA: aldo/keto reductase [Pseudonocardiaceae bacterium]|nr:aldo/keto reductase [Pseudonocardiaceae bacterium]